MLKRFENFPKSLIDTFANFQKLPGKNEKFLKIFSTLLQI